MTTERPICVLIAALGGQGGGVLTEWLEAAAHASGYPAQATSTPGVAQRTGATTYYFELYPETDPPGTPIFTLFPASGDVDLMVALEPSEAGRSMERGFITETTSVITATDRLYSISEKLAAGDGTIKIEPVIEALEKGAKSVSLLDIDELIGDTASRGNAIMLGAIAGSGVLPLEMESYRNAIRKKGVAVDANLAGFEIGLNATGADQVSDDIKLVFNSAPESFNAAIKEFPESLAKIIGHGVARLLDYQDDDYARLYLERLQSIVAVDGSDDFELSEEVAAKLAAWMSFEDVIRVAQLKTRPERLSRIRGELGLDDSTPLRVTDYFKPGRHEMIGILPPGLRWLVPNFNFLKPGRGLALHLPTGSAFGYGLLKILALMKPWRAGSTQNKDEQAAIEKWLAAIRSAAPDHLGVAGQTAKLAILARGYGDIRRSGLSKLNQLFEKWEDRLSSEAGALSAEVDQLLILAHADPDRASGFNQ